MQAFGPALLLLVAEGSSCLKIRLADDPACSNELADELGFDVTAGGMFRSLAASRFLKFASSEEISCYITMGNGRDIPSPDRAPRDRETWTSSLGMKPDVFQTSHTLMLDMMVYFVRRATKVRCLHPSRKKQRCC